MKYNLESAYGMKTVVENLFGSDAWYEVKHSTDLTTWKKYANRILSAISLSAEATVRVSDPDWHVELDRILEHGKLRLKQSKDTEELFASLAATSTEVCFHQLGYLPKRSEIRKVTLRHKSDWTFDSYRSVQYVQTEEQVRKQKSHNKTRHGDS